MSAVAVLAIFAIFAVLMYRRMVPALVALPLMAVTMALAAGVPAGRLGAIVGDGAAALAPVYAAVVFGALLGRVTLDTGIARRLVNLAAEYGGERPLALALGICAIVALLFTSLSGLGAIIMVGSIVLPVMMTGGVPRTIAATLTLMAFALGFIFNIANWTFYATYFGIVPQHLVRFAIVLAALDAIALVAYAVWAFRRERGYATWASWPDLDTPARIPAVALVTPLLPLVLYYTLHVPAVPAFALAAIFGALVVRPRDAAQTLVAAAIRGVEDVAPALLLFMGIGMLLTATKEPQFSAALAPLVAGGWIRNPLAYVAVFGLASPLALYRGPLNPFGVGIAIFTVLLTTGALAPVVLVAGIMAVVQVQNVCDPTNTANVWIANFTGVPIDALTKRTLPFQVGVATAATLTVALAAPALFGLAPFSGAIPAAHAQASTWPQLFAPGTAAGRLAVGGDGSSRGAVAVDAVLAALSRAPWKASASRDDPNAAGCASKPYAAFLAVTTSQFTVVEGTDVDVGLRLEDCGGWIVAEWHEHQIGTPDANLVNALSTHAVQRMLAWAQAEPVRSHNLFQLGVAAAPGDPPSYFYAMFKTVDGKMRVYARAGGPAYGAGLRSGDVVDAIDGRDWWQYGTYQSQQRAYDGLPHRFRIERGGVTLDVSLNQPFTPEQIQQ